MITRDAALAYADAGLAIIPIAPGTKRPLVKWAEYRDQAPNISTLAAWTRRWPAASWACILGPASGGLAVLDFDAPASYAAWSERCPDLAQAAPTVATARGRHVYLQVAAPTARMANYAGEVKGRGGYVLLPPSLHPSGRRYTWLHGDLSRYVPRLDSLAEAGIVVAFSERPAAPPAWQPPARSRRPELLKPCAAAVLRGTTLEGQRNDTAWRLALHLRAEGWSHDAALHLLTPWAERSGTPARELAATVGSAYRPDRLPSHGCRSAELSPYCHPSCPLARYLEVRHAA